MRQWVHQSWSGHSESILLHICYRPSTGNTGVSKAAATCLQMCPVWGRAFGKTKSKQILTMHWERLQNGDVHKCEMRQRLCGD